MDRVRQTDRVERWMDRQKDGQGGEMDGYIPTDGQGGEMAGYRQTDGQGGEMDG